MMVTTKPVRDYLAAFDLRAVFVAPAGDVRVGLDPGVADAAWWTGWRDAHRVARRAAHMKTTDILAAAADLDIAVTPHARAMARAQAAVGRIDARLAEAQANGDLRFFNSEFKRRRLEAAAAGQHFVSYSDATRRLLRELAGIAAGKINALMVARVLGDPPPAPVAPRATRADQGRSGDSKPHFTGTS